MDAISNHSLNTTSFTARTATNRSAQNSPTKQLQTSSHGFLYSESSQSPKHSHPGGDYLADVLQAKRNCRAGLAVWLHCVTSLNNVFMAHIHRTLWPAFEASLQRHRHSLLAMQRDFRDVLREADSSLLLLRDHVLSIIVKGFSAVVSMRQAVTLEYAEISVVEDQNKLLDALHPPSTKPANKEKEKKKKVSRNPRVEMRSEPRRDATETYNASHR